MKKFILSLFAAAALLPVSPAPAAIVPQIIFTQTTNAVITWPSAPGDSFMVLHRGRSTPLNLGNSSPPIARPGSSPPPRSPTSGPSAF